MRPAEVDDGLMCRCFGSGGELLVWCPVSGGSSYGSGDKLEDLSRLCGLWKDAIEGMVGLGKQDLEVIRSRKGRELVI